MLRDDLAAQERKDKNINPALREGVYRGGGDSGHRGSWWDRSQKRSPAKWQGQEGERVWGGTANRALWLRGQATSAEDSQNGGRRRGKSEPFAPSTVFKPLGNLARFVPLMSDG